MMDRSAPDDFDTIVRDALADVARATQPAPDLADLLVANVRSGRPRVTRLAAHRQTRRWLLPLLAAASVIALAAGGIVVAKVLADRHHTAPPAHHKTHPVPPPKLTAPVVPDFHAADISFSDSRHGWAVGDAKCRSSKRTDCPALLATKDGGRTWRALSVPTGLVSAFDEGSCSTNGYPHGPCVDSVLFANPSDGYLWSLHDLYSTTDGGRHWSRYVDPAHDWDGASKLVAVGGSVVRLAPLHQCSSGCAGSVQYAPLGTTKFRTSHPTPYEVGLYSSNLAVTGSQVYLFAGITEANVGAGIFRSDNGGRSWTRVAAHVCGRATDPQQDPFAGDRSAVAANGAVLAYCLGSGLRIAAPGSSSFVAHRLPRGDNTELDGAASDRRIVVADLSQAFTTGAVEATFYVTTDSGATWQRTMTIPVLGGTAQFPDGVHGWAIAQGGIALYTTDDGGRTWGRTQFGS